jgi:hypothetical protein
MGEKLRQIRLLSAENRDRFATKRTSATKLLESISFTRKNGQYLRWDYRSGRRQCKKIFDKGEVLSFEQALCEKINEIVVDISPVH